MASKKKGCAKHKSTKKSCRLSGGQPNGYKSVGEKQIRDGVYSLLDKNVTKATIKEVIDGYWETIQKNVSKGKNVQIFSIGSFRGQRRKVQGKYVPTIKFSISPSFKKVVMEMNGDDASVFPIHTPKKKFNKN